MIEAMSRIQPIDVGFFIVTNLPRSLRRRPIHSHDLTGSVCPGKPVPESGMIYIVGRVTAGLFDGFHRL